jgi:Glycosyl hydrolases family 16
MKTNNITSHLAIVLLLLVFACGKDETEVPMVKNLTVNIEVDDDGSGQVVIDADADNVKFYKFFLGETVDETPITTTIGLVSHTYEVSGSYTITVEAHSSESDFLSDTQTIEVELFIPIPANGYTTPTSYSGMSLLWQDEFDGTSVDADKWSFEIGNNGGWGNNELEYYRQENATIVEGNLMIEAKKESFAGKSYTSTRMITKGKLDFKYGRIDVRAALPEGQGIWPAIWMLGSNINEPGVGWPKCGEIDIMEMIGGGIGRDDKVYGTAHWFGSAYANYGGNTSLTSGIFKDNFHVFSITWDENYIRWYLDDVQYHVIDITPADLSEFRENFFLILNVAVGGNWPGNPNDNTEFPQRMFVDYVRVFQPL